MGSQIHQSKRKDEAGRRKRIKTVRSDSSTKCFKIIHPHQAVAHVVLSCGFLLHKSCILMQFWHIIHLYYCTISISVFGFTYPHCVLNIELGCVLKLTEYT